jgi:glycosyltransferase involved in cell wall biosynthesis
MISGDSTAITAIVPRGTGAIGVHRQLSGLLPNYRLVSYPASLEYTPWRMRRLRPQGGQLVHCPPDHAVLVSPPKSPLVVTFHNYVLDAGMHAHSSLAQRLHYSTDLRWLIRSALRRASAVTAVSQSTADLVREDLGFSGSITVIPNSVDSERFTPSAVRRTGAPRILFCGTPSRRKGFHWLPSVARGLAGRGAELVCATGEREAPGGDGRGLTFLGAVPQQDMPSLYRSCDALLLPSVREGMSLAMLEAMATALPVVAWSTPSNRETLGAHQDVLLAPPGDIDGLISRVRWTIDNPSAAAAIGDENRRRALARHDPHQMAGAYAGIFSAACDPRFGIRTGRPDRVLQEGGITFRND